MEMFVGVKNNEGNGVQELTCYTAFCLLNDFLHYFSFLYLLM